MKQLFLLPNIARAFMSRPYSNVITVAINRKGVIDVDTIKGCSMGMAAYPEAGCYGECYAYKNARTYGFDFRTSVSRQFMGREHKGTLIKAMLTYPARWYRVGVAGDPCHDWSHTVAIISALWHVHKVPVIVTKHWAAMEDWQIIKLRRLGAVVNTSISGMDTDTEIEYRVGQLRRLKDFGIRSVCRVVTCNYGTSEWARLCKEKQNYLLSQMPVINNPLRASKSNPRVVAGEIILERRKESIGGGKHVSLDPSLGHYLGNCRNCPDQCGVSPSQTIAVEKEDFNEAQAAEALLF